MSIIAEQYLANTQTKLNYTSDDTMLLLSTLKNAKVPIPRKLYYQMNEYIENYKRLLQRVRGTDLDRVRDSDEIISAEQSKLFAQQIQQAGDIEANLVLAEIELHNNQFKGGLRLLARKHVKKHIASYPEAAEGLGNGFYKTLLENERIMEDELMEGEYSGGRRRRKSTRRKRITSRKKRITSRKKK